jgi:glycosyltransferase involved in cell wall biosynthesis
MLKQNYHDFDIVLINDNPKYYELDDFIMITYNKEILNGKIIYIVNLKNYGLTKTLNYGISVIQSPVIARQDADDYSFPDRLKIQTQVLFQNKYPLVSSNFSIINENGDKIGSNFKFNGITNKLLLIDNIICHSSVTFNNKIIQELGQYRDFIKVAEDFDLWLRLVLKGYSLYQVEEILVSYRQRFTNISNSNYLTQLITKRALIKLSRNKMLLENSYSKKFIDNYLAKNLVKYQKVKINKFRKLVIMSNFSNKSPINKILLKIQAISIFPDYLHEVLKRIHLFLASFSKK